MTRAMETVQLVGDDGTALGTAGNPLVVSSGSGGGAANQYPGADYATSGKQDAGNASISTVATGIGAPADAASASGSNTSVIGALRAIRDKLLGSLAVTGTFWQATQPVSGTFWQATQPVSAASLPLPVNAAQDGADPASPAVTNAGSGIRGWLATIAGLLKLGAQAKAGSGSVTIATDQGNLEPGGTAITGAAMPAGGLGLTGWLSAIWQACTGATPAGTNIIGAVTGAKSTTNGVTPFIFRTTTAANSNVAVVKTGAGKLFALQFTNSATAKRVIHVADTAGYTAGTTPDAMTIVLGPSASVTIPFADIGVQFANGIIMAISTAEGTAAAPDATVAGIAGNDVTGMAYYA